MKKLACFLLVFAAACSDDPVAPDLTDTEAIQIAYFAELIEAEPWSAAAAYCVSTGTWENRQDPTDAVLSDLRRLFGKIQPASLCVSNTQGTTYNGELARSYHIESIAISGNTATVAGFYRQHALDGAGYEAQVQKQSRLWVVVAFQMTWVA